MRAAFAARSENGKPEINDTAKTRAVDKVGVLLVMREGISPGGDRFHYKAAKSIITVARSDGERSGSVENRT